MTIIPGLIVPAPEPLGRRYGLLDAASGPLDLPTHGQGGGVRYVPNGCGSAYAYGVACYEAPATPPDKPIDTDDDEVSTGVFAVLSTLNCGAPGYDEATLRAKVLRRLESDEQSTVETALWSGLDFEGNSLDIRSLSGEAVDIGLSFTPDTVSEAVAALERYAYFTQGYGGVAYIHAPIEVAAFAASEGMLVERNGIRRVTPMGSVWVFGAYPAGSMIITGQTTVWRSEVSVASAFDRVTNERLLLAERTYAIGFDCFAGSVEFDPLEEVTSS